jgi:hypothetical protein
LAKFAHDPLVQGKKDRGAVLIFSRVLRGEVLIDHVHFSARLIDRDAGRQPSIRAQKMNTAEIRCDWVRDLHRRPRFSVVARCDERGGHHTDDGVHVAAERNRLAENLLVSVELLYPQVVAQHNDERRTVPVILARDETSARWFDSQRFKEPAGHLPDLKLHRLTAAGVGQRLHNHATESAECFGLRFNISQIRRGLIRSETDQSRRIVVRQRSQQHGVDDTEDCGISTYAERESDHSDNRECRPLDQTPQAIANVFND